jgi:hypothetical protein
MGRPAWKITPEILAKTERLAAQGLTQQQIGACLGVRPETISVKKRAFSQFAQAIKDGRSKGIGQVSNALFESALEGSVPAQIFFLKNRDPENWADVQQNQVLMVAKLSDSQLLEEVRADPQLSQAIDGGIMRQITAKPKEG